MYTYEEFLDELESPNPRVQVTERLVGGMREITNIFYLNKVKTTDEGTYQCSMSNNFGRKISNEAVVTVQGMSYTHVLRLKKKILCLKAAAWICFLSAHLIQQNSSFYFCFFFMNNFFPICDAIWENPPRGENFTFCVFSNQWINQFYLFSSHKIHIREYIKLW